MTNDVAVDVTGGVTAGGVVGVAGTAADDVVVADVGVVKDAVVVLLMLLLMVL